MCPCWVLFAGKFVDFMGTKKGYLWAIGVWSAGAVAHALCGWLTVQLEGYASAADMAAVQTGSAAALLIATTSVWLFVAARCVLALGEAGNFPTAAPPDLSCSRFWRRNRTQDTF